MNIFQCVRKRIFQLKGRAKLRTDEIEKLSSQLGIKFLSRIFSLNENEEYRFASGHELPDRIFSKGKVLTALTSVAAKLGEVEGDDYVKSCWVNYLTEVSSGTTRLKRFRQEFFEGDLMYSGEVRRDGHQGIEGMLKTLVEDCFIFLLMPPPEFGESSMLLSLACHRHPVHEAFKKAVECDEILGMAYTSDRPYRDKVMVSRSTGNSCSISSSMVASNLLRFGSEIARARYGDISEESVYEGALRGLSMLREGLSGKSYNTPYLVGLKGGFPNSGDTEFGSFRLRRLSDEEVGYFVPSAGSSSEVEVPDEGISKSLLLIEVESNMKVHVPGGGEIGEPIGAVSSDIIERIVGNLVLASVLVNRDRFPLVSVAWVKPLDPFDSTSVSGDLGAIDKTYYPPVHIEDTLLNEWINAYDTLSSKDGKGIEIAKSRLLLSVGERRNPADSLIDALICWEALFGSKEETSFKVTSSVAWILVPELDQGGRRRELYSKLSKLYDLRSRVVHGATDGAPEEIWSSARHAVDISARLLWSLLTDFDELLDLNPGSRAKCVLIEGVGKG